MAIGSVGQPRIGRLVLLSAGLTSVLGCSTFRSIEQWKCDNWGMCHFGIKPSQQMVVDAECCPDGYSTIGTEVEAGVDYPSVTESCPTCN